jgi:single-strand DNA-binding protein
MKILRNTLAVNRRIKPQEGEPAADFIPITAFGKTAEFVSNYFSKGKKIAITGRIQTGSYDNAEGKKVYTTEVIVEEAEFVEPKEKNEVVSQVPDKAGSKIEEGYFPINDEDVPF